MSSFSAQVKKPHVNKVAVSLFPSLPERACAVILMCLWQFNWISRPLVKSLQQFSPRKAQTLFFHVLQNAARQPVDDPLLRWSRKQGRAEHNLWRMTERGQKKKKRLILLGSRFEILLHFPSLSSLSWMQPTFFLEAPLQQNRKREGLGMLVWISFRCLASPLG